MDDFVTEFNEKTAAKSREVCERIEREDAERRSGLSEVERRILEAWPRFEDGKYVWFGDSVEHDGTMETVQGFKLYRCGPAYLSVVGIDTEKWLRIEDYKSVKRPVQSVLDADGVEIKVGDTVWNDDGVEMTVTSLVGELPGHVTAHGDNPQAMHSINPKRLTHARPDSWERLEEDAGDNPFTYCKAAGIHLYTFDNSERAKSRDIIRRAKALAGVGAARDED